MAVTCTISLRGKGTSSHAHYHLKAVSQRLISMDELAERISESCTLTPADVVACLAALNSEVKHQLQDGNTVDLGWLGRFSLGLQTQGHALPNHCTKADIKAVKINYRPSLKLKRFIKGVTEFKIDPAAKFKYKTNS
jgi:predicted histone-like DNA-binding protein